jgi:O-antigen/teichoic acid export membrane protein
MLGVIVGLGVERAAQYFVASGKMTLSQGISSAAIIVIAGSVVVMTVGSLLIDTGLVFFTKAETDAFYVSLFLIPVTASVALLQLQLAGLRKYTRLAVNTLVQTLSCLVLIGAFVWYLEMGAKGAILANIASGVLALALLGFDLHNSFGFRLVVPSLTNIKALVSYGLRYFVARIGHRIDIGVGTIVLAMLASKSEIGFFAAASAIALKVLIFSQSIETSLFPHVAADKSGRTDLVRQCMLCSILLTTVAMSLLLVFSTPLVRVVLSPKFLPAVPLIWILAPGIIVHSCSKVLVSYFRGVNRPGVCSVAIWFGLVGNVVLLLSFYPVIGIYAAAWAMTAGYLIRFVIFLYYYKKSSLKSLQDLLFLSANDFHELKKLVSNKLTMKTGSSLP